MLDSVTDHDAVAIGLLYSATQTPSDDRLFHFAEAGTRLLKKKESLSHGEWLRWIRINRSVLGFNERGARSLIQGAQWMATNWSLATALEEIVTDPNASDDDLAKAAEIRQLIACQFRTITARGTLGRRQNEWYTPHNVIERARAVLGVIDCDPASCAYAQQTVKARQYFDKHQNGLAQPWHGRVWLNPPYAPPLINKFVAKLLAEWDARRVDACLMLTHNYSDSSWFHDAAACADAICFTQGRIAFYDPNGAPARPTQGQSFFYFGREVDRFKHEFGRVGFIARPEPDQWCRQRVRE